MDTLTSAPILLVDDEPANLLALEAALQDLGEPLVSALSGEDAMRCLRDRDFAAVLLDVRMPRMDGFETARLIRAQKRSRETPILFITADASDLSAREGYSLGAVDFLVKPIRTEALVAKLGFFVDLHRSKHELREAERRAVQDRVFLSAVLEAVEDAIVACDSQGQLTLLNRAAREFLALSPHAAPSGGIPPSQLFQHADGSPMSDRDMPMRRALAGEHVEHAELLLNVPGITPRPVVASGQALYDEAGHKLGAVVSMHDVTARHEAETAREAAASEQMRREEAEAAAELIRESRERLRESEQRVRLATDAAGLGVWVWDSETDHVTWENERLHAILGLRQSDPPVSIADFVAEFAHADDLPKLREAMAATVAGEGRMRVEGRIHRRSDRALRWIEVTGILQANGGTRPARVLGTMADITDRKHAEEELRASEERYRTLFESIDEGFCIIEMLYDNAGRPTDYRFIETNPAFAKHTGMDNVVGKRMRELVPGHDAHWFELYGQVAATGEAMRFEQEAAAMERWFDVYAARLGGAGSARVAILFSDITQRKEAEDSLRRLAQELAETDRRKTEFLATLAHELRNPLAPLSNGLHLMRRAAGDIQAQDRARQMMERQLRHLVHLVDDLLDIARISSNKVELRRETLDLAGVLAGAVETSMPLIAANGHLLETRLPPEPLQVTGDGTRLAQIVSNLLNNAAKYTPHGGRIELSARAEGGEAVIEVRDSGVGIAVQELPNVFEMFTQVGRSRDRAQGGLGIGLALVKRLVELHGGKVEAHSEGPGRGSTFVVRLPLAGAFADGAPEMQAPEAAAACGAFRVLVVDDNEDAADSLAALLQIEGHDVRIANDGDTAIRVADEFHPHVVFLDIGMPGKDGYQVARDLRANAATRDAVLVALTGWGAQEDRARSRSAGFDHHLTKPAGLASVEALLAQVAAAQTA